MNNIYFDNNKPTQSLIELLDYIGLTLDDFKALSKEELQGIIAKLKKPLDVGRETKSSGKDINLNVKSMFQSGGISLPRVNDKGDLSRYFSLTAWSKKHFPNLHNIAEKTLQLQEDIKKTGDLLFVCKPSQSEKNAGLDGCESRQIQGRDAGQDNRNVPNKIRTTLRQNTHPTTKPIVVYNYLITLFSKEGDIILDPFCGSGVTPIACVLTNRRYIGIDISEEYCKIAEARVEYWKEQKEGAKIPSASKKNVSASISKNEAVEKQESQQSLF